MGTAWVAAVSRRIVMQSQQVMAEGTSAHHHETRIRELPGAVVSPPGDDPRSPSSISPLRGP